METLTGTTAFYRLDDGDDHGYAVVKVLKQINNAQAKAVKAATGHDLYQVECVDVPKPSSFAPNPKVGKKKTVSSKLLTVIGI